MKKNSQTPPPDREQQAVQATAWFSVLMHARSRELFHDAVEALTQLAGLGVVVKFRKAKTKAVTDAR